MQIESSKKSTPPLTKPSQSTENQKKQAINPFQDFLTTTEPASKNQENLHESGFIQVESSKKSTPPLNKLSQSTENQKKQAIHPFQYFLTTTEPASKNQENPHESGFIQVESSKELIPPLANPSQFSYQEGPPIVNPLQNLLNSQQISDRAFQEEEFYERVNQHTSHWLRGFATLIDEAPKSPDISMKLFDLSLTITKNITNNFLPSNNIWNCVPPVTSISSQNPQLLNRETNFGRQHALFSRENQNSNAHENQKIEVDLRHILLEDIVSIDKAFQALNLEAGRYNYKFIKGPTNKKTGYRYFYCKYRFKSLNNASQSDVMEIGKKMDKSQKAKILCSSYYSLKKIEDKNYALLGYDLNHTHRGLDVEGLTEAMREDLYHIPKWISIVDVVDFLESKYSVRTLNYQKVYYELRKIRPLLGLKDCAFFLDYLTENKFLCRYDLNTVDQSLCKIILICPVMKDNYDLYGDIILVDSTYQTNLYKVPLVVFTGISSEGKNVLFGLAYVNNETFETYKWVFSNFFELQEKKPGLLVTDGDLAICKAVEEYSPEVVHFICQWHLLRNFNRHFGSLKKNNPGLYETILHLPYIEEKEMFEKTIGDIKKFFQENESYTKSLNYLNDLCHQKHKWADCYKANIFTAGTNTTSGAESQNRVLKRYLNVTHELSAMLDVIRDLDNSYAFQDPLQNLPKIVQTQYTGDPMMVNIQGELGEVIYKKHYEQYSNSKHYNTKLVKEAEDPEKGHVRIYEVQRDQEKKPLEKNSEDMDAQERDPQEHAVAPRKKETVELQNKSLKCSCHMYEVEGILCRHMFCVAAVAQVKDLSPYIHSRWSVKIFPDLKKHAFSAQQVGQVKRQEEALMKEEERIMDQKINFKSTLESARRITYIKDFESDFEEKETEEEGAMIDGKQSDKNKGSSSVNNFPPSNTKGRNKGSSNPKKRTEVTPGGEEEIEALKSGTKRAKVTSAISVGKK